MSQRSRKYHNRIAKRYESMYEDAYWQFHDEITWRAIKPHLPRDANAACLDLGCGAGKWGLKLLKSGFNVTFIDHAPAMVGVVQEKLDSLGARGKRATAIEGDIIELPMVPDASSQLTLAMGDPLSICTDPAAAAREMFRTLAPGGIVIATADNKLAALRHVLASGDIAAVENFARRGKTNWLTDDSREQFELTMFTPGELQKLFERVGFDVLHVRGKTLLDIRGHKGAIQNHDDLRRLADIEEALEADSSTAAAASHLQITARKPSPATADSKAAL